MINIVGMSIIVTIVLFAFITFLILKKKWKTLSIVLIVSLLLIIWMISSSLSIFQKSINLSSEGLNGVEILSSIDVTDTNPVENNKFYRSLKENKDIYIGIDHNKIIELTLPFDSTNTAISTNKGIHVNSTFKEVVSSYGESYKEMNFVDMYGFGIEFKDKENKINIRFYFDNDSKSAPVRNIEILVF